MTISPPILRLGLFALCGALAGCASSALPPEATPVPLVSFGDIETDASGRCFATEIRPQQFRSVTQQVLVVPEERDRNNVLINAAIYRNESRQERVPTAPGMRFETLCPPLFTAERVATLQRALAARGAYAGTVSGQLDAATQAAIQRFQIPTGLNSPHLAIATARSLGLISVTDG